MNNVELAQKEYYILDFNFSFYIIHSTFSILPAFLLCTALYFVALWLFPKIGLLDFPERYGLVRHRLPYPTGIVSVLVFVIIFAWIIPPTMQTIGVIMGIVLLASICFVDDRRRVHPGIRLLIQTLVAFIIFATGSRIYTLTNPFMAEGFIKLDTINIPLSLELSTINYQLSTLLPVWSGVFTIFWLLITMNALNWFDGIPGQVSTLSFIGFLVIGFLSLSSRVNQPELAQIAFVLAGISAAGLLFDFPPNKVLMGDTGAMFFGLMLGVLTLYAGGKVATAFLVLGVPLIDVFIVIVRRIAKGCSPLRGNAEDEHLHHRLLRKGWSERQVIVLTAGLGTLFGTAALFLSTMEKFIAAGLLLIVMLVLEWYTRKVDESMSR